MTTIFCWNTIPFDALIIKIGYSIYSHIIKENTLSLIHISLYWKTTHRWVLKGAIDSNKLAKHQFLHKNNSIIMFLAKNWSSLVYYNHPFAYFIKDMIVIWFWITDEKIETGFTSMDISIIIEYNGCLKSFK